MLGHNSQDLSDYFEVFVNSSLAKFPNKREEQRTSKTRSMEEATMKRFTDLETTLWEAIGKLECTILAAKRLEKENAEIKADIEAYKLILSESERTTLEALKRLRKCLKKLLVWEKQKKKLQDDIAVEKQKISDSQQKLFEIEAAQKETEAKWKQARRDKEQAFAQLKVEIRRKEEAKATNKRRLEGMQIRFEIASQVHKDDLQRLHQELSQLKASASNELPEGDVARVLRDFDRLEVSSEKDTSSNRTCVICRNDEVSVVFLPCAHQALYVPVVLFRLKRESRSLLRLFVVGRKSIMFQRKSIVILNKMLYFLFDVVV